MNVLFVEHITLSKFESLTEARSAESLQYIVVSAKNRWKMKEKQILLASLETWIQSFPQLEQLNFVNCFSKDLGPQSLHDLEEFCQELEVFVSFS